MICAEYIKHRGETIAQLIPTIFYSRVDNPTSLCLLRVSAILWWFVTNFIRILIINEVYVPTSIVFWYKILISYSKSPKFCYEHLLRFQRRYVKENSTLSLIQKGRITADEHFYVLIRRFPDFILVVYDNKNKPLRQAGYLLDRVLRVRIKF